MFKIRISTQTEKTESRNRVTQNNIALPVTN